MLFQWWMFQNLQRPVCMKKSKWKGDSIKLQLSGTITVCHGRNTATIPWRNNTSKSQMGKIGEIRIKDN